jgi:cobalt/nickel transport system permease protein
MNNLPEFAIGLFVGQVAVLATVALNCLVLAWGGEERWDDLARLVFLTHLPIALVEGVVLGFTIGFLCRVKPEMVSARLPEKAECTVHSLS